jgi:hypothetical protein
MKPNKLDEYTLRPRNAELLFIRTAEYLGETQIDIRRVEMVYQDTTDHPGNQLMGDNLTSDSTRLDQEPAASVI